MIEIGGIIFENWGFVLMAVVMLVAAAGVPVWIMASLSKETRAYVITIAAYASILYASMRWGMLGFGFGFMTYGLYLCIAMVATASTLPVEAIWRGPKLVGRFATDLGSYITGIVANRLNRMAENITRSLENIAAWAELNSYPTYEGHPALHAKTRTANITRKEVHPATDEDVITIQWGIIWRIGAIIMCFVISGVTIALTIMPVDRPVHQVVTTTYRKVIKQVIVPATNYPPLKNYADACKGHPVYIVYKSEAESQSAKKKGYIRSWFTVRPAGDNYTVACNMGGAYDWQPGDLVILNGELTG